ncbi:MAG: CHAP domain-containing protein [Acidimicrobiales bacterium]|jgi:hypothetical protein
MDLTELPSRTHRRRQRAGSGHRLMVVTFVTFVALVTTVAQPAAETGAEATGGSSHAVRLQPNDTLPRPSWWNGPCDVGNNSISYKLTANFDGLQACGPGSDQSGDNYLVQFFPGAWGEYEWECVELSMRWMYLAWGVKPYGANGNGVVADYPNGSPGYPTIDVVKNGTAGKAPQPGDVLSIDNSDDFGHTEVVASSSVNGYGDGTVTAITENDGAGSNGWASLPVTDWLVSDGIPGDAVLGWLHNPAWSLELPVSWKLTSSGDLLIQDWGGITGSYETVATGIAHAEVVGGDGYAAAPIVVALTTGGELEGGYYLPGLAGRSLAPIASGVKSFALSAGPGVSGHPVLGWVTGQGHFEISSGGLFETPVEEAANAASITVAPNSGPGGAFIGYLSTAGTFYDKRGSSALETKTPWNAVASDVGSIALAGGDMPQANAIETYTSNGTFFARRGLTGAFTSEATNVAQVAVTTVGTAGTPLLAYISGGQLEVAIGPVAAKAFVVQGTGVAGLSVAAGMAKAGFPIVGAMTSAGFELEDGALGGHWTHEGAAAQGGVASLTVS